MKHALLPIVAAGLMLLPGAASADETVLTVRVTTVRGKAQRPAAAIDISRARVQLGATTPTLASGMTPRDASRKDPSR